MTGGAGAATGTIGAVRSTSAAVLTPPGAEPLGLITEDGVRLSGVHLPGRAGRAAAGAGKGHQKRRPPIWKTATAKIQATASCRPMPHSVSFPPISAR